MKKLFFILVSFLMPIIASADAVEINGVYYNLISKGKIAEVTSNPNKYSGDVIIPEKITYEGIEYIVKTIDEKAFSSCVDMTSIIIPQNIITIKANAFEYCSSLSSVSIPSGVTFIEDYLFQYCINLTSINIPNSVTKIGNQAFYGCRSLTTLVIPESVTSIGAGAFQNCNNLESIDIPDSVTYLGGQAFEGCSNLRTAIIGDGLTNIYDWMFKDCFKLEYLALGRNIETVGYYLVTANSSKSLKLKTLEINCKSVNFYLWGIFAKKIIIGKDVSYIKQFMQSSDILKEVHILDLKSWCEINYFDKLSNPLSYSFPTPKLYLNNEEVKGDVIIPNGTNKIANHAFAKCNLASVTIPNSVTLIESFAFYGCRGLTSVTIPNSVTSIGESAFHNCGGLTSVTIPNSVTTIGDYVFEGCTNLLSIDIPNSVTSLGGSSFKDCSSLSCVKLSDKINIIGSGTFEKCSSLTTVDIPNNVQIIYSGAFKNCSKLSSISIGAGTQEIYNEAFAFCSELADVYCYSKNVPTIKDFYGNPSTNNIFEGSYIEYATLHVPKASIEEYKSTEPWKGFKEFIALSMPEYMLTYMVDGEEYKTFKIEEGTAIEPEPEPTKEGYTFSGWGDIPETMPDHDVIVIGSFEKTSGDKIHGHEFVDLGLPSGRVWAKTNYGASSEGEYGEYVYWPSRNIIQETWGKEWSTPSSADIIELYNNCTFTWEYNANSIFGCRVTGTNGKSIFLPAAGYKISGISQSVGESIYYWDDNEYEAGLGGMLKGSQTNGIYINGTYNYNYVTMPIRPVANKPNSGNENNEEEGEFENVQTMSFTIQTVPSKDSYSIEESFSIDTKDVENFIGTAYPELYGPASDAEAEATGSKYTNAYSCDPKPGFWITGNGRVGTLDDADARVGISYFSDGLFLFFQYPGRNNVGEVFKAELYLVNPDNKKMMTFDINVAFVEKTEEVGINTISTDHSNKGQIFGLSGRRIKNPTRGLYIQNGKKYVIK